MILTVKKNLGLVVVILSSFCSVYALKHDYIEDDYTVVDAYKEGGKYAKCKYSKGSAALKRYVQGYNGKDFSPNGRNRRKLEKARAEALAQAESVQFGSDDQALDFIEPEVNSFFTKRGEANIAVRVYDNFNILKRTQQRIRGIIAQASGLNVISTLHLFNQKHATILYTGKTVAHEVDGVKQAIEAGIESFCLHDFGTRPMCLKIGGEVQIYGESRGAGKKFLGVPAQLDDRADELLRFIICHMPDGYKSAYRNLHVSLGSVVVANDAQAQQLARVVLDAQVVASPFFNAVDKVTLMPSQGRRNIDYNIALQPKHCVEEPVVTNAMDLESFDENYNPFSDEAMAEFGDRMAELWKTVGTDVENWGKR